MSARGNKAKDRQDAAWRVKRSRVGEAKTGKKEEWKYMKRSGRKYRERTKKQRVGR